MGAALTIGATAPGSWTATSQPSQVGSGAGADRKPMARWISVPYRASAGTVRVGVAAFHINGINRVEFQANNGTAVSVTLMTMEAPEGGSEIECPGYWVDIDCSGAAANTEVEVRATVYPETGTPRVLQGDINFPAGAGASTQAQLDASGLWTGEHRMVLYANPTTETLHVSTSGNDLTGDGSAIAPFATIAKAVQSITAQHADVVLDDEATYTLESGTAMISTTLSTNGWVTIRGADGLDPANVLLQKSGSNSFPFIATNIVRTCFRNLTIDFATGTLTELVAGKGASAGGTDGAAFLWLGEKYRQTFTTNGWNDGCGSRIYGSLATSPMSAIWATEAQAFDTPHGFVGAILARGCWINKVSGDVFQNCRAIVNNRIRHCNTYTTAQHTDLWQFFSTVDCSQALRNIVIFQNRCAEIYAVQTGQYDQNNGITDFAIVNNMVENVTTVTESGDDDGSPAFDYDTTSTQWSCARNFATQTQGQSVGFQHVLVAHNTWLGRSWSIQDQENAFGGGLGGGTEDAPERPRPRDFLVINNLLERVIYSYEGDANSGDDLDASFAGDDEFTLRNNIINQASQLSTDAGVANTVTGAQHDDGGNFVRFTTDPSATANGAYSYSGPQSASLADRAEAIPGFSGDGDYFARTIGFTEQAQSAPTVAQAYILAGGDTLIIEPDTTVNVGAGGSGGFAITASGGAATLTFMASESFSLELWYSVSRTINTGETVTLAYTQPGNGVEATPGGADMESFSDFVVDNRSVIEAQAASRPFNCLRRWKRR